MLNQINALTSPVARMLLSDLYTAWTEAIIIPNSLLPKSKHGDDVADGYELAEGQNEVQGRSAFDLLAIVDKQNLDRQEMQEFLEEKETAIRKYEAAIAEDRRLEFHEYVSVIKGKTRMLLDAVEMS